MIKIHVDTVNQRLSMVINGINGTIDINYAFSKGLYP